MPYDPNSPVLLDRYWMVKHYHLDAEGALEGMAPITIWGQETNSEYAEDAEPIEDARRRGFVYGWWFSQIEPEGELGTWHTSRLESVPKEVFEAARQAGWPRFMLEKLNALPGIDKGSFGIGKASTTEDSF